MRVFHRRLVCICLLSCLGVAMDRIACAVELYPSAAPPVVIPAPVDSAPEHATTPFIPSQEMLAFPSDQTPRGAIVLKRLSFIGVRQLPAPMRAEVERRLRSEDPARGEVAEDDAGWPDQAGVLTPLLSTQGVLRIEPRELGHSAFTRMRPLGWVADHARLGESVSSVERHFRRDDGVLVVLREWNYAYGSAAIFTVRELVNGDVSGHPAILSIETAPSGRVRSSLNWQDERTDYRIVVLDDVDRKSTSGANYDRKWLLDLARSLGT